MTTTLHRRGLLLAALPLGAALLALPALTATAAPTPSQSADQGSWTIMYYGAGDNDLDAALATDVNEMAGAGFGGEVKLYALLDRSSVDYSDPYGEMVDGPIGELGDFDTAKVFHLEGDTFVEDLDIGEIDTADPDNLAWFIDQVMRIAPADNTALVFSDHGAGAYAFGVDEDNGTSQKTRMTAQTVAQGIADGLAASGEKLDVVVFDACLMANFETVGWMADVADLFVGSEDTIPTLAFNYTDYSGLTADPDMTPQDFASMLIDSYANSYNGSDFPDTSLSVINLSKVAILDKAVSNFATALSGAGDLVGFQRAVADSTAMAPLDTSWGFLDLGDVARRLAQKGNPPEVRNAADAMFSAVQSSVVQSWGGLARQNVTGLSIAIPPSADRYDAASYAVLGSPAWSGWLDTLFSSQDEAGANTLWAADVPDVELLDSTGLVISALLDQDAVAEHGLVDTLALFGEPTTDGGMQMLLSYPAVEDSGEQGRVSASWAFQVFALDDGGDPVFPTTRLSLSEDATSAWIDGTYTSDAGEQPAQFDFAIDPESGALSDVSLWVLDETGAWGPLSPVAGSTFTPEVFIVSPDGTSNRYEDLTPLSFDAGLTVAQYSYNPGAQISGGLLAVDGSGGESIIFGTTEVPAS